MAATWLFVDKPVASLQADIETAGNISIDLAPDLGKQLQSAPQQDGKVRIIVFGLNQTTFSGRFASVDASVAGITGVVTADPNGGDAGASVSKLSTPTGLRVSP